jgi:hypothetical protein
MLTVKLELSSLDPEDGTHTQMAEIPTPTPSAGTARRNAAATNRSTAAKKAAATRARNQATEARKRSTAAKQAAATRRELERTPVERYVDLAGRAVTIPVGAALVARDSLVSTVGELAAKYSSLDAVERELRAGQRRVGSDLRRFERRGTTARDRFERELRRRRERVERDLRSLRGTRGDAGAQAGLVGARLEHLVQSGMTAGSQVAAKLTERVARIA